MQPGTKGDKFLDWQVQNRNSNAITSKDLQNTDEALKLYNKTHKDSYCKEQAPSWSDYYRPSKEQVMYVSGGMIALGCIACKWI